MKTKIKDLKISDDNKQLLKDVLKTRSAPAMTAIVKACILRRDELLGKEVHEFEFNFDAKIKDNKSRKRLQRLCADILKVKDRKALSVLTGQSILHRKACRDRAKGDSDA